MNKKTMAKVFGFLVVSISMLFVVPKIWAHEFGRMTGGGSIILSEEDFVRGVADATGTRITHGFELHCGQDVPVENQPPAEPNNLEINIHTSDGSMGRFHLEHLDFSLCRSGLPDHDPAPPQAPFYWYEGEGTGRFNGEPGYFAQWVFTDEGEPGREDRIYWLTIYKIDGPLILQVNTPGHVLTFGNHQAHKATGNKP